MTSGRKTKLTKPDETPDATFATKETVSRDRIEKALDGFVRHFLKEIRVERIQPGMPVIMSLEPSWWFTEDGKSKFPTLTAEKTAALVQLAKSDPHAYDAACYLAGVQFSLEARTVSFDWPDVLRIFGASVLFGDVKRPAQRGRKRDEDVPLRMWKYALCRLVAANSSLPLGRNREPSRRASFSACDAVAEACCRAGHPENARRLESFCYDAAHANLRALAELSGLLDHKNGIIWLGQPAYRPDK